MTHPSPDDTSPLVSRIIALGWLSILLSAIFLFLSGDLTGTGASNDSFFFSAMALMIARIFGMGGFAVGAFCLFHERWNHGVLLIICSVVLPIISLHFFGTI